MRSKSVENIGYYCGRKNNMSMDSDEFLDIKDLTIRYSDVLSASEAEKKYIFKKFSDAWVRVVRRNDNIGGTLAFADSRKLYFDFRPDCSS